MLHDFVKEIELSGELSDRQNTFLCELSDRQVLRGKKVYVFHKGICAIFCIIFFFFFLFVFIY